MNKRQRRTLSKAIEGVGIALVIIVLFMMALIVYVTHEYKDTIAFFDFNSPTNQQFDDRTGKHTGEFHIRADPIFEKRDDNYALVVNDKNWLIVYNLLDIYPKDGAVELMFKPSGNFTANQTLFEKINLPDKESKIWFYIEPSGDLVFYSKRFNDSLELRATGLMWTETWHHVAVTWGERGFELWFDYEIMDLDHNERGFRFYSGDCYPFMLGDDLFGRYHAYGAVDNLIIFSYQKWYGG